MLFPGGDMKRILAAMFFILFPLQGFAKEQLRKFRWSHRTDQQKPLSFLGAMAPAPKISRQILRGVGEFVMREGQMIGRAHVVGTWKQTVSNLAGEVTYAAGALLSETPDQSVGVNIELTNSLEVAMRSFPELENASRIFPPSLEVRKQGEEWLPYWRVEYLSPTADRLRYVLVARGGAAIGQGEIDWDGIDGRADVFPFGSRLGGVQEEVLRDLSGDGTITGRLLHVFSALDLKVWSPELRFFFPQEDRRFDLGQAYFTLDKGYRWLKEHLGIELEHPIDVRLHVGNGGVSNAAFYHKNTIYLGTVDGETYRDMIRDPSVLIHEGIHAVVDAYAGLPSEGEGGGYNEGFADLFTALILDNPRMGEASYLKGPYRRTLEHKLVAYRDFAPGVYQNGSIVAATFWDMKAALGNELVARLAFRTLVRLGSGGTFDDFGSAFRGAAEGLLSAEQEQLALGAARARGWRVE